MASKCSPARRQDGASSGIRPDPPENPTFQGRYWVYCVAFTGRAHVLTGSGTNGHPLGRRLRPDTADLPGTYRRGAVAGHQPDGREALTGSHDTSADAVECCPRARTADLPRATDRVYCVAFTRTASRCSTGSSERHAVAWDRPPGETHTFQDTGNVVYSVAFSPDGKRYSPVGGRLGPSGMRRRASRCRCSKGTPQGAVRGLPAGGHCATGSGDGRPECRMLPRAKSWALSMNVDSGEEWLAATPRVFLAGAPAAKVGLCGGRWPGTSCRGSLSRDLLPFRLLRPSRLADANRLEAAA